MGKQTVLSHFENKHFDTKGEDAMKSPNTIGRFLGQREWRRFGETEDWKKLPGSSRLTVSLIDSDLIDAFQCERAMNVINRA